MAETEAAVRRFLEGEEEAFSRIARQWEKRVYNLAWRMLGNREDAQDAVQETFLSVFKSLRSLRDPGSFSTWIYRITLNHCRARRRPRAAHISLDDAASGRVLEESGDLSGFSTASKGGEALEALDIIRKALAGVSENHRAAVVLKEYMGLSLEELALVMECPLSTAKSRVYQGLREVQRNLVRLGFKLKEPQNP